METPVKTRFVLSLLALILFQCKPQDTDKKITEDLEKIQSEFIPDKREKFFDFEVEKQVIHGKTDQAQIKAAIAEYVAKNANLTDSIALLPAKELGSDTLAFVRISVANIRSKPGHSAELSTQALMGTPIRVLDKKGSWYLVQSPDHYLGYVDSGALSFDNQAFNESKKLVFSQAYGTVHETQSAGSLPVTDIVFGDLVGEKGRSGNIVEVAIPGGRSGYLPASQLMELDDYLAQANRNDIENIAVQLMGVPYLWGGTSFKGVDCSGFTRTVYMGKGLYIPRDASQQAKVGQRIEVAEDFSNVQKGDLLFFGRDRDHVTHVALYLGDKRFIHSSGMVRYASFDSTAANYDAYNLKRLLFAQHLSADDTKLKLNDSSFYSTL
ncbi:C40 family peptidase [Marinilongibacter aquaticus]|uniref:C40 family peptidase n=1 Tax=Marinilongibacter aquaticus TaxID=2975157 RepID=UPI0021BD96D1|nr:C40 family peptidase [Marinilongibacter aquaticus]UBM58825.1 C40 family peptidase [Marinilongibacter aquaticus]